MDRPDRELRLEELPHPPLFKLVDGNGRDVFERKEVGGELSSLGILFSSRDLAEEFSEGAAELGLEAMTGLDPGQLPDWNAVEDYASGGEDYLLVISERGTGLFFADDVAHHASRKKEEPPFPLYVFTNERGEAPLISVEDAGGELLVAVLFSSPEKAHGFRERAAHLNLPELLAAIDDAEGLRRHALIARRAGTDYAVIDPEAGMTEAIPLESWIS
ncbi:MAG: hypothetical protein ACFB50_11600 [Rubrobacteraceae bacterium]